MKLQYHLLVSAACVAAFVTTTTPSVAAQTVDVSDSGSASAEATTTTKLLRGYEQNYDDAVLFPFLDESEDAIALIPAAAVEFEIDLDDAGEDFEVELVSVNEDSVVPTTLIEFDDKNTELQDEDLEYSVPAQITSEDYPSEYARHLRSLVDPAPAGQIQLAETTPRSDLEKSNLRGPEQGKL
ncbi:hypothetical protein JG687_00005119 [Phytophthora cactorum]|uniref:RxLR effector protein n=1 Tax=Phytophthora cactorum TaxID=29920 RepID=A0A329SYH2_9STRA|nr:hypothetical protein Pcac1_g15458 [Phytophthora cactorum]KAG2838806.1 hypothetical protein PC112_g4361 [Phytophthora cactorum]KAG2840757.1 hypothetical protein PC111_g3348 [Phytophthora cactorum]KAG2864779.1 hypothetical protein PC113_g4254 [Phytophthora cactorum]KAG2923804.1 hypothetical protein PC114_g4671 [Phytophthora cactorum]